MTQSFFAYGRLPGMNDIARKHHQVYAKMKNEAVNRVWTYIKRAKLKPMVHANIAFEWHESTQARDPDNIMAGQKFVLDALVHAKVLPNDGWGDISSITHTWVQSPEPGVKVTLRSSM